ncbi:cytochrome P450 3A30-like isoform X1 [Acanthopagrus latus]|uniref:cytochrome P450 3A30-like isoform X1 n=2 Tax=Acanthopagrus latus TaxID=8177 RepID=UPI00187C0993|nr:cytochrome P450 3A30-like isoform X1 [Acanthopagrus latus]
MDYLPFFSLETWILLITCISVFVMYGKWTYKTFEELGIPGPKPIMYWGTVGRHNVVYYLDDKECAKKYGRVWGGYEFRKPVLAVMDPDMLKTILVKECFTYFTNRRNLRLNGELFDAVNAVDDHWRKLRNILSPNFTSGRIKEMFSIMKHHSHKLTTCLQSKARNNEVITMKDFFGAYTVDTMASCVFSVDMETTSNPSSPGPFITHLSKLFRIPLLLFIFQACFPIFLPVLELLGVSFFPKSTTTFFKGFVEKVRAERNGSLQQNSEDILQNMINSQTANGSENEKQNKGLTDHEIISQVTMLMFAGYETSSTTLTLLAYSLARNPEVMKHLQVEIDSTFPNKGPIQYEALVQMEYLDSVVSEGLRLYPPVARLERTAKGTVEVSGVTIPKNILVIIPVYTLHHDPELWPEPEEFKPERFSKQNKQNINQYTYLPFGFGPRNCIGMRFGLVMVKLALVEVLQSYSFSVCEETEIPLTMDPEGMVGPKNPIKLKLVTRSVECN